MGKKKKRKRKRREEPFLKAAATGRKDGPCDEQGTQCIHPLPPGGGQDDAPKGSRVKKSSSSNKKT